MIIEKYPEYCNTENLKQGHWGEMYVKRHFESRGYIVIMNPDTYGAWDMVRIHKATGKSTSIQVKTIVRFVKDQYFGLKDGPMEKTIDNLKLCDELIIVVRNPHAIDDPEYKGLVLRVKNHKNYRMYGKEYRIPSKNEYFDLVTRLTEEELHIVSSFKTHKLKEYKG